jgi:hypothetical protein
VFSFTAASSVPRVQQQKGEIEPMCASQRPLATILAVACLFVVFVAQSGCGVISTSAQKTATPVTEEKPILLPHQSHRTIHACLDITSSIPYTYFEQARDAIAQSIDESVTPNQDGLTGYVSLITSNSWDPASTLATITVPAIAGDPPPPKLAAVPAATGDPFTDAKAKKQISEAHAKTLADYQRLLKGNHRTLAQVRSQVKKETNALRSRKPSVSAISTDIWGCIGRADMHFQGVREPKVLLIESDLENNTDDQRIPDIHLSGVHVKVIYHYCSNAPECSANDTAWKQTLLKAGAADVLFFDPAQSSTLSNLFS